MVSIGRWLSSFRDRFFDAIFAPAENFRKPIDIYFAIIQLMAGGGVALIGTTLVPLLSGLFG